MIHPSKRTAPIKATVTAPVELHVRSTFVPKGNILAQCCIWSKKLQGSIKSDHAPNPTEVSSEKDMRLNTPISHIEICALLRIFIGGPFRLYM